VKFDSKPRRFFLKELIDEPTLKKLQEAESKKIIDPAEAPYAEKNLHPFLAYFAYTYLTAHTKTIRHSASSKKSYAQWLHPDVVGASFPIDDWQSEVLDFGMVVASNLIKLYSFELKKQLGFGNIRESFFQTVSNSTWANEAYLVAAKVAQDDEFMSELKRLSTSFGIGIIRLDIEDPDSSEILFPAKFKSELDWDTINKLAAENADFRGFLKRIKNDLSSKEVRREKYDHVFEPEKLVGMITP